MEPSEVPTGPCLTLLGHFLYSLPLGNEFSYDLIRLRASRMHLMR